MATIPTEIKGTVKAWFTSRTLLGPQDLAERPPERVLSSLGFYDKDMTGAGWSLVGDADITIRLIPQEQMIDSKVDSLKKELEKVRADATARETEITAQINTLLAIGYAGDIPA